jgi:predicted Zn-dependent protease
LLRVRYFDGATSRAHDAGVFVHAGQLTICGSDFERRVPVSGVEVSEPTVGGFRILTLAGGGICELGEGPEARALLGQLGHRDSALVRSFQRWGVAAACVVAITAGAAAVYAALPSISDVVARWLPQRTLSRIGEETLALLDRLHFEESELPADRCDEIRSRLAALTTGEALPEHRVLFRSAPGLGANAFALPGGAIVLTDELVELAEHDDELIGVLAHELGHLERRHALRGAIHGSVVGLVLAAYLGDLSSLGAGLSGFLLEAKYSRDFEREADDFAERFLRARGIAPSRLTAILERMSASEDALGGVRAYLSTHPLTSERIRELQTP